MAYQNFYQGTPSSLDPNYGEFFTGYRMNAQNIGLATDPRTAAQIQEFSTKLSSGQKAVEVGAVQANIFEAIPRQHFKEMNALSKLTGTEVTLHAPLVEASGYNREGGWSENNRVMAERQMLNAMEKAHEINPKGNVPVTFHSTVSLPEAEETIIKDGKEVPISMYIVDPRSGKIGQIKDDKKHFPGEGTDLQGNPIPFNPKTELERMNKNNWIQNLEQVNYNALRGSEAVKELFSEIQRLPEELERKGVTKEEIAKIKPLILESYALMKENPDKFNEIPQDARDIIKNSSRNIDHASIFLRGAYRELKELYSNAYENVKSEEEKKKLNEYKKEVEAKLKGIKDIENPRHLKEFTEIIESGIRVLEGVHPETYKPLKDFVIDKSAESFGNVAWKAFKDKDHNYQENTPIIAIENPPYGGAISKGTDLKKLIEESQKKFVEQATASGMSKSEAEKQAQKLIGATWDVGHINMMRKFGYSEKDVVDQSAEIRPFLKKVHLSDNFGLEHTELPMGMGNVPIAEIMKNLGKEGYDVKKIVEAGDWWQHMKSNPMVPTFEAFGSQVYGTQTPYWNQIAATNGNYFAGYGTTLPDQHFTMYGAGFSNLPADLGGQVQRKQGLGGTPVD